MMRRVLAADEKPLHWVGSAKRDFLEFPREMKDDMGNALGIAQFGGTAPTAKRWKGLGPGVLEVVESHEAMRIERCTPSGFRRSCCTRSRRSRHRVFARQKMSNYWPSA
jgi:hypothetical protein